MLAPNIAVNHGHDRAIVLREIEPGGGEADYVTHAVVTTQRMIDRLYANGVLNDRTDEQRGWLRHQAASNLRNDYERGAIQVGDLGAQDTTRPVVSGGGSDGLQIGDEEAAERYEKAMKQLGRDWRPVVRFVVIEDKHPKLYGDATRSSGHAMLACGLDVLIQHYGLVARRRAK